METKQKKFICLNMNTTDIRTNSLAHSVTKNGQQPFWDFLFFCPKLGLGSIHTNISYKNFLSAKRKWCLYSRFPEKCPGKTSNFETMTIFTGNFLQLWVIYGTLYKLQFEYLLNDWWKRRHFFTKKVLSWFARDVHRALKAMGIHNLFNRCDWLFWMNQLFYSQGVSNWFWNLQKSVKIFRRLRIFRLISYVFEIFINPFKLVMLW